MTNGSLSITNQFLHFEKCYATVNNEVMGTV